MATPTKHQQGVRSNASDKIKSQENSNPNLISPAFKPTTSLVMKSPKSALKTENNPSFVSPKKKIRERKFVVAKKKDNNVKKMQDSEYPNCKCNNKVNGKCLCVAYENLRASQEDFFKRKETMTLSIDQACENTKENKPNTQNFEDKNGYVNLVGEIGFPGSNEEKNGGDFVPEEGESPKGFGSSTIKRRRDILLEEARASVPEPGSGRVLHFVKAFERLLTMPKESDEKQKEDVKKGLKCALPGLQQPPTGAPATEEPSAAAFCPGELFFNSESLGLDAHVSSSLDSSRGSVSSRSSNGSRRSRRSGSFSSGTVVRRKSKQQQQQKQKVTSLRPFSLRTEQRGKMKEEEFIKKLQELMIEEEKQRIPIAQGLPWSTDEPECLIKPPIKECTKPIDLKLHSDMRAVERAEFDHQVAEKLSLIEEYKMERERQQKLEEEDEIRRLRKELVPKAQPMPYFDRPFIPRRSEKQPTIPKEPKFHIPPQQKKIKCGLSWNDYIHAAS